MSTPALAELLEASAALHRHLCPRQVLGVRMALWAGYWLKVSVPQTSKRLLALVETDGCFADGVAVGANCWVGRRTLRVLDYGKVAATFVDTLTGQAVRLTPRLESRQTARAYAPTAKNKWEAQLWGYQHMPVDELLSVTAVTLTTPLAALLSRPGVKVMCDLCGEEIINEREVRQNGQTLCRPCATGTYYALAAPWPVKTACQG